MLEWRIFIGGVLIGRAMSEKARRNSDRQRRQSEKFLAEFKQDIERFKKR